MSESAKEASVFDEPADKDRSAVVVKPELDFDGKVADLEHFITFEPLIREIDYKILCYCDQRRGLHDIEEKVATFPQFKSATRDQYSLITELVRHHGLELFELDERGNVVTDADKEGLDEDGIDDLVAGYAYQTTDVGKAVADGLAPSKRLEQLFAERPQWREACIAVMRYLVDRHTFAGVDSMLRSSGVSLGVAFTGDPVQPSVVVDKLERAGIIVYDEGWILSDEGKEALSKLDEASA